MGLNRKEIYEHIDDALSMYLDISTFEISKKDNCFSVKIEMGEPKVDNSTDQVFVRASTPPSPTPGVRAAIRRELNKRGVSEKLIQDILKEDILKEEDRSILELLEEEAKKKDILKSALDRIVQKAEATIDKKEESKKADFPKIKRPARTYHYKPKQTLTEIGDSSVFRREGCENDVQKKRFVSSPTESEKIWINAKTKYEEDHKCIPSDEYHKRISGSYITGGDKITEIEVMAALNVPKIKVDLPISTGRVFSSSRQHSILHDGYMMDVKGSDWKGSAGSKAETKDVCKSSLPKKTRIVGDGEPKQESKIDTDPQGPAKKIRFSSTPLLPKSKVNPPPRWGDKSPAVKAADGRDIKPNILQDDVKKSTKPKDVVEDDVIELLYSAKSFIDKGFDRAIGWFKGKKKKVESERKDKDLQEMKEFLRQYFASKRY